MVNNYLFNILGTREAKKQEGGRKLRNENLKSLCSLQNVKR